MPCSPKPRPAIRRRRTAWARSSRTAKTSGGIWPRRRAGIAWRPSRATPGRSSISGSCTRTARASSRIWARPRGGTGQAAAGGEVLAQLTLGLWYARRPRRPGRLWRSGALVPRRGRSRLCHRPDQSGLHVSRRAGRRAGRRHGGGAPDARPRNAATRSRRTISGCSMPPGAACRSDPKLAAEWHERAASQGLANAQYQLGLLYERGEGVARDDAAAARWYRQAAQQGEVAAQTNLGLMYRDGRGVRAGRSARLRLAQPRGRGDERTTAERGPARGAGARRARRALERGRTRGRAGADRCLARARRRGALTGVAGLAPGPSSARSTGRPRAPAPRRGSRRSWPRPPGARS